MPSLFPLSPFNLHRVLETCPFSKCVCTWRCVRMRVWIAPVDSQSSQATSKPPSACDGWCSLLFQLGNGRSHQGRYDDKRIKNWHFKSHLIMIILWSCIASIVICRVFKSSRQMLISYFCFNTVKVIM